MAQPGTTKIPVGTVLAGKYRITREIGRGGMAAIYEAENIDIGKRVAIKVLAQELLSSSVVVERFLREARAAAAIRSPYICDVYDSGRLEDNRPFLVLELLEGESLFERLTHIPHLDAETTLTVITQVCRGLTKAHAANIVHRDLKPENIFLTHDEEGRLLSKILDFGLAKFYAPLTGPEGKAQARLTREGAVFGTPAYMAPEQVRGQGAVDHRADLWALGCITYECLTGKTVWKTEQGVAMTFAQIAGAPLPDAAESRPDLPVSFKVWFEKALARDLERRFQTAKEFSEALVAALGSRNSAVEIEQGARAPAPPQGGSLGRPHTFESEPTQIARPSAPGPLPGDAGPTPGGRSTPPPLTPPGVQPAYNPAASPPTPLANPGIAPRGGVAAESPRGDAFGAPSSTQGARRRSPLVLACAAIGGVALLAGGSFLGWKYLRGQDLRGGGSPNGSGAAIAASGAPSVKAQASADAASRPPPWLATVREAQQKLSTGDLKGASKQLKEAFDKSGNGMPRTMLEQVQIGMAAANGRAPCQLTGLARPRTYDIVGGAKAPVPSGRPSITLGPRGPVIAWTDGHAGSDHVYVVLLDQAMRPTADPIDVTPDATSATRPELTLAGDKLLLTYWEQKGSEPGVHARWLNLDGGPSGSGAVFVGTSKARVASSAIGRADDGALFAIWSNESEAGSEDLFLRKLSSALEPQGDPARATDFVPTGASKPKARYPSIAVKGDTINVAFRLERDPARAIHYMRLPVGDAGNAVKAPSGPERVDRMMGDAVLINTDKSRAEAPSIACGTSTCVITWHTEMQGGVSAAYIEQGKMKPAWNKRLTKGLRPTISAASGGDFQLAWFDGGRVLMAKLTRDGLGAPTKLARVISDQPPPSVAAGEKAGEWYVAWLDYETGHLEPYAARVQCR